MMWTLRSESRHWFCVTLFVVTLNYAGADDSKGSSAATFNREASRYRDDLLFLSVAPLSFAFLISLIGSMFAYVSFLDRRITMRYQLESSPVEADVISADNARSITVNRGFCSRDEQKEYNVVVEYDQILPPKGYRMRVRKRVQVFDEDFIHPNKPHVDAPENPISSQIVLSLDSLHQFTNEDDLETGKASKAKIIFNQDSFFEQFVVEERKLELLVIPGNPKSGFPLRQHARKMDPRYRLPFFSFLGISVLLTILCIKLSVQILHDLIDMEELRPGVALALIIGSTTAIALQAPCAHLMFYNLFQHMLEEEYYESGDLMPTWQDDSTLSSGSDTYLLDRYKSMDHKM